MAYAAEIRAYRQEFLDAGDSMDGAGPLRRFDDPAAWLREIEKYTHPETVPADKVQATQFICVRAADRKVVGMLQVRHTFNDYLEKYAGHIGYSVRPSERRKGYASWMLRKGLAFCRSIGLKRVLITCKADNEASRRTILSNGGVYESTVFEPEKQMELQRYWIDLSAVEPKAAGNKRDTFKIEQLTDAHYPACMAMFGAKCKFALTCMAQRGTGNREAYALFINGEIVSECHIVYSNPDYGTIPGKRVYLSRLSTRKEYRRRGYGAAMAQYILDLAKEKGCSEIALGVNCDNTAAVRLYEKLGFTVYETSEDAYGRFYKMEKKL